MAAIRQIVRTPYAFTQPGAGIGGVIIHDIKGLGPAARGWLLKRVKFVLRGNYNVTALTTAGTLNGENPWGLVTRIICETSRNRDGVPDGKIRELTPRTLIRRRSFDRGFVQPDIRLGTGGVGTAIANYAANSPLEMPFGLPRLVTPVETALALGDYNSVRFTLNLGGPASIFVGNVSTVDLSGLFIDVIEEREYNPKYEPLGVVREDDKFVPIAGANAQFLLAPYLPTSGMYIDALVLSETTNATLADTIINRLYIDSGVDRHASPIFDEIKADQQDFVTDLANPMVGVHYLPFLPGLSDNRGLLRKPLPDVSIVADVSNPGVDRLILSTRRIENRVPDPTSGNTKPGNN